MKLSPIKSKTCFFDADQTDIFECCDSVVAVLTDDLIDEWMLEFKSIVDDDDAADYCAGGSTTQVFDIDGENLVVVADSGGELASGDFQVFCEDHEIPYQFIIDSLDCTDIPVDEIHTGMVDDNVELLKMVHKLYN